MLAFYPKATSADDSTSVVGLFLATNAFCSIFSQVHMQPCSPPCMLDTLLSLSHWAQAQVNSRRLPIGHIYISPRHCQVWLQNAVSMQDGHCEAMHAENSLWVSHQGEPSIWLSAGGAEGFVGPHIREVQCSWTS